MIKALLTLFTTIGVMSDTGSTYLILSAAGNACFYFMPVFLGITISKQLKANAFVGGAMALRWGVMRVLMLGALLSASSNLLFAWLAGQAPTVLGLTLVVSADNLAGGIASAAFIAYLSSLTNVQYSATQYALFSSMMMLAPKWLAGFSGQFVDAYGYVYFFVGTACLGLPVLVLVALASRVKQKNS